MSIDSLSTSPSTVDVLFEFHKLNLPALPVGMDPLDDEALAALRRVEGYADPGFLAGTLTSAITTLWVARKSNELPDEHADATLWLLAEVASLLEHAIEANKEAAWWQAQHENATSAKEATK